jgi:hypothetical protein
MNFIKGKERLFLLVSILILVVAGSFVWIRQQTEITHYFQSKGEYESEGLGVLRNPEVSSKYIGNTENLVKYNIVLPKLKKITRISNSSNIFFSLIPKEAEEVNVFDAEFANGAKGNSAYFNTKYSGNDLVAFYKTLGFEIKTDFFNEERGFIELENEIFIMRLTFILSEDGWQKASLISVNK